MQDDETLAHSRLAAFSDAVFAVAITLLVLDLHAGAGQVPLSEFLRSGWPDYVVFLVSFAIIGIKWINHHRLFARIRRADTTLMLLNLLLLLGITIVPFTTALLLSYLSTPDAAEASLLYGLVWTLNGIAYTLVLAYAQRRGYVADACSPANRRMLLLYALGPFGYAIGAAFSFLNVYAALAVYCIVVFAYIPPQDRSISLIK